MGNLKRSVIFMIFALVPIQLLATTPVMVPIISYLLSGDTAAYQVKASDVNNTAYVLDDKTKITFYPTGYYEETGFDGNDTYWDEGVWDVNSTVNAIELVSINTSTQTPTGDIVFFAFQHANPTSGDIITARVIDDFGDERFTAAITSVIPLVGDESHFNNPPQSTVDDLNSTAIRSLEGYALNLFVNGMYTLSIDADTGLSKVMTSGFWGVDSGVLDLTDENGSQVIRQMIFDPQKPVDGSLGYVLGNEDNSTFVIRQVVDINATDPETSPYAITSQDISNQVVILMNGASLQFYNINTSNQGYYREQGRSDLGIYDENGIYELNTTNGTVTLYDQDGYVTVVTANSKPDVGTVLMAYEPSIDELTPYVIRRKFSFDSSDTMASLTNSSLEKQMVLFTDGSTFRFHKDGIFRMYAWSTAEQTLYAARGTWKVTNGAANLVSYYYHNGSGEENSTKTMQCNNATLAKGVKCNVTQDGLTQDKIIKKVIPLYNDIQAIDTYPEYEFKAISVSGSVPTSTIAINGVNYTVVPYSKVNISSSSYSVDSSYNTYFYGQSVSAGVAPESFDGNGSIVLKVFKGSEFVGSSGPFDGNSLPDLGEHGFSEF